MTDPLSIICTACGLKVGDRFYRITLRHEEPDVINCETCATLVRLGFITETGEKIWPVPAEKEHLAKST